jgi:RNA polymerase sigma-70 factor (ECF subfamily)
VERIAGRDQHAFSQLYDATSRLVYGMVLRLVRDAAVAEDITMEVFMQIWRTATSYDTSRGSVNAWLITVARSRAIDWIRSSTARFDQHKQPLDAGPEPTDHHATPEASVLDKDRAAFVRQALAGLPPEQRQLIELSYFSGLSQTEMAAQLSLPLGTVKSRVRIGMTRLRELLAPYTGGEVQ